MQHSVNACLLTKWCIAWIETLIYYVFSTYENMLNSSWKHVTEDWLKMHFYLWKQSGIAEIWRLSSLTCYHWQWFIPCCCWCQSSCPHATHSPTGNHRGKRGKTYTGVSELSLVTWGKGWESPRKPLLCVVLSVNNTSF